MPDLDPHIDISRSVPTQRLHNNWPDGQRRQLARHFYGLTAAQILEEEDKERLRDQGAVLRKRDPAQEEGEDGAGKDPSPEHVAEVKAAQARAKGE